MKVIFLDFDGVITDTTRSRRVLKSEFDTAAVENLKYLIEQTGARIVVSSVWRTVRCNNSYIAMATILAAAGLGKRGFLHEDWRTHPGGDSPRGENIKEWLSRHPEVTSYVILDDSNDMLDTQMDNFVHVDYKNGLTFSDVTRAMEILNCNTDN